MTKRTRSEQKHSDAENKIQKEIIAYVENFKKSNEIGRTITMQKISRTNLRGAADLNLLMAGMFIVIELKTEYNTLQKSQVLRAEELIRAGGNFHVICCLNDFVKLFDKYLVYAKIIIDKVGGIDNFCKGSYRTENEMKILKEFRSKNNDKYKQ